MTTQQTLGDEFYLDPDVKVELMQREGDKVFIRYLDKSGRPQEIMVDYVLAATGRRPNVDKLGLENTSLILDERGVPQADRLTMQTNVPHILLQVMPAISCHYCMKPAIRHVLPV